MVRIKKTAIDYRTEIEVFKTSVDLEFFTRKNIFQDKGEISTFSEIHKLEECITSRSFTLRNIKGSLLYKRKITPDENMSSCKRMKKHQK